MVRRALLVVVASAAALAGCQGYRFKGVAAQPVVVVQVQENPISTQGPPTIMIVQDLSGSMCEPIQQTDPNDGTSCLATAGGDGVLGYCSVCSPGGGTCTDSTECGSKLQLVSANMATALQGLHLTAGQLNIGLASFGSPSETDQCATGTIQVPVGDAVTTIPKIAEFYKNAAAGGGTPTAATLGVAATDPALTSAQTGGKFIFLVTDGLPNCAEDAQTNACLTAKWPDGNVYGCTSPNLEPMLAGAFQKPPAACQCSFGACANPTTNTADCCEPYLNDNSSSCTTLNDCESWYCLDDQGTDGEIASLYSNQQITTDVVGMGYDFPSNPSVLQGMATAGNGTLYEANSPTSLTTAITSLLASTVGTGCKYVLDAAPVNPELIVVTFNGTQLVAGDPNGYTFMPPQTIIVNGAPCDTLEDGGTLADLKITAIGN